MTTPLIIICVLSAGAALAQDLPEQISKDAMKPATLNDLGTSMRDHMTDIIREDIEEVEKINTAEDGMSLFAGSADEDPDILKIRKIARELESQSAMMI